jgi:hypothetical protein
MVSGVAAFVGWKESSSSRRNNRKKEEGLLEGQHIGKEEEALPTEDIFEMQKQINRMFKHKCNAHKAVLLSNVRVSRTTLERLELLFVVVVIFACQMTKSSECGNTG